MSAPDVSLLKKYKAVFLDLDNTLYAYAPCHTHALKKCYAVFNKKIEKISFATFQKAYLKARAAVKKNNASTVGARSRHLYFQLMLEHRYGNTQPARALMLGTVYTNSFLQKMKLRPWVLYLLKTAKKCGTCVVIVTNQESSFQNKKLLRLGIAQYIDYVVTSEEAGIEKPDIKIFKIALAKVHLKPDDVLMIGDDKKEDGHGARRAGIRFKYVAY